LVCLTVEHSLCSGDPPVFSGLGERLAQLELLLVRRPEAELFVERPPSSLACKTTERKPCSRNHAVIVTISCLARPCRRNSGSVSMFWIRARRVLISSGARRPQRNQHSVVGDGLPIGGDGQPPMVGTVSQCVSHPRLRGLDHAVEFNLRPRAHVAEHTAALVEDRLTILDGSGADVDG
jgi:hypothetical protein